MRVRSPGKLADPILFAVLFCAVAIGWLFGRAASTRHRMQPRSSDYYKGLNYLLDAKPDAEMDTFIASLDVNEETFETHMALGHLLRKKGEVQRAIRVHQNLLNASDISPDHQHSAHLELARDYISAGLLDRAEHLLLDLISESPQRAVEARRYLIEIYQTEREWEKAAAMASSLLSKKAFFGGKQADVPGPGEQSVNVLLPHFYCELCEQQLQQGNRRGAEEALEAAAREDGSNVRVTLMYARLAFNDADYEQTISLLHQVEHQDPDFLPETLPLLKVCYTELGRQHDFSLFLRASLAKYPTTGLMLALADHVKDFEGVENAAAFLADSMRDSVSLRGLYRLLLWQLESDQDQLPSHLEIAMELMKQLSEKSPAYRCHHCGFGGRHLHWFCPGCKFWGSIKPMGVTKVLSQ
jgi:lipopolysaccharide assembly protein B